MRDTILIVYDEEINRELLRQMFENKYKILTAKDGKEGIMLLGKHINEVAIILLDIVMPVINGYQVLQILHNKDIISKIPVVLITAQDDSQTEFQCYQLGATALISKPFAACHEENAVAFKYFTFLFPDACRQIVAGTISW